MIIVEIAYVKYDKNGNYDYTVESNHKEFENEEKAMEFINSNLEKDYEFYLYNSKEDVENGNHYKVIISNEILK